MVSAGSERMRDTSEAAEVLYVQIGVDFSCELAQRRNARRTKNERMDSRILVVDSDGRHLDHLKK